MNWRVIALVAAILAATHGIAWRVGYSWGFAADRSILADAEQVAKDHPKFLVVPSGWTFKPAGGNLTFSFRCFKNGVIGIDLKSEGVSQDRAIDP